MHPAIQPTSQLTHEPVGQPANHPTNHPVNQPTNKPTNKASSQPTNQPDNQTTNQPTNQTSGGKGVGYSIWPRFCKITDVEPCKNVQIHVFPGGRIQHLTQVLQNYRRNDCTKLKNVIILFGLNDALQRKGTVVNSFIGSDMQDRLLLAKRKFDGAIRSTTQGSTTHMPLTLCTHLKSAKSMTFIGKLLRIIHLVLPILINWVWDVKRVDQMMWFTGAVVMQPKGHYTHLRNVQTKWREWEQQRQFTNCSPPSSSASGLLNLSKYKLNSSWKSL